jgi:hypothetical protein
MLMYRYVFHEQERGSQPIYRNEHSIRLRSFGVVPNSLVSFFARTLFKLLNIALFCKKFLYESCLKIILIYY